MRILLTGHLSNDSTGHGRFLNRRMGDSNLRYWFGGFNPLFQCLKDSRASEQLNDFSVQVVHFNASQIHMCALDQRYTYLYIYIHMCMYVYCIYMHTVVDRLCWFVVLTAQTFLVLDWLQKGQGQGSCLTPVPQAAP